MLRKVNLIKEWTARLVDRADCGGAIMLGGKRDISYLLMQQADIADLLRVATYLVVKDRAVVCNPLGHIERRSRL